MTEPFRGLGGRVPASVLARALADRLEDVVPLVLSGHKIDAAEARGHGQDGALWVVARRGSKRGVCLCATESERSGDMLTMVAHALHGGSLAQAYAWAAQHVGGAVPAPAPAVQRSEADSADEAEIRRKRALARYLRASSRIRATPVEAYLAGRGITELPGGLRFSADCYYAGRDPAVEAYPAMLAPVIEPISRQFLACHCTYLTPHLGTWRKIAHRHARKCWGPVKGGLIPLRRGASNKPIAQAPEEALLIGEGIENVLSAAVMWPELRAAAGVAIGNLADIALPEQLIEIKLVMDRDGENPATKRAIDRAVNRWLHEGRAVTTERPPPGHEDFNAWLQAELARGHP